MTDKEFDLRMKLIVQGDKSGLKDIYDVYGKMIYNIILTIVKVPQDAEDLTSDFFLRLWNNASQYKSGAGHKRYITVIARNSALDFLRKQKHIDYSNSEKAQEEIEDSTRIDDKVIGKISFSQALSYLNDSEKEIISYHLGMELTFKEIAKLLSKPAGTIAWKYRNAVSKLKLIIKEDGING